MPTPANAPSRPSARREDLLAATVRYVAEHNVSDLSLRPLAAAIGTSPRVLLYLFGSKEDLVREVLAAARAEQLALLERSEAEGGTPRETLELLWHWVTAPDHRGALRLFFEGYVRAFAHAEPWRDFGATSLHEWLPPLTRALTGTDADADPTLVLAVLRGLLLDLLATGEEARVQAAWRHFLDTALAGHGGRTA
ncbi:TetR/AcrR family transcriptional regulator [Kitasatospora sp. NPDC051170]|uniref:TetR/AcrR family transcriptional regulator n=1 Tax=Kitasatospora sp. NPDC051170 TaxID=3364056 RepID=UPI0037920A73